jgi:hypothetical protein
MVYNVSERLNPTFYQDSSGKHVLERMNKAYMDYVTINQAYQAEADLDTRFYAGDQTLWFEIYGNSPYWGQKRYYFNIIKPAIELVTGYQRQHKKSISCSASMPMAERAAQQMSKSLIWSYNQAGGHEVTSKAFDGACIQGLSFVDIDVSYEQDPINGDIVLSNVPYNYYWIDPFYKNFDMSDAESVWRRQALPKSQVKRMFNYERDKEIDGIQSSYTRDGKFIFIPENYYMKDIGMYMVDEFYYRSKRKAKFIVDVKNGQSKEWVGKDEDALEDLMRMFPSLDVIETEVPTITYNIVVNGHVMYSGPHPTGLDCYPMTPFYGYYNPELTNFALRHQGLVRSMRDPQFLYNRFLINSADVLESQINSGWKYKENAVVNPEDLHKGGNGINVKVAKNANMSDIEKIQPGNVPPSMLQLQSELKNLIYQTGQVNEELMGMAKDDVPGILAMVRQGAGLTGLQRLFDQLDSSQKILGEKMLSCMQTNWKEGKFSQIVNEELDPQIKNKTFFKFNINVDEVAYTDSQKRLQFQQLMQLQQLGVQIPTKLLIENSPLVDKGQLYKEVAEMEEKQAQAKAVQDRLQLERIALENQAIRAESKSKESLAAERLNKVSLDAALSAERIARAENDKARADLELVEAAYKLQSIDIDNLKRLIDLLDQLKPVSDVEQTEAAVAKLSGNIQNAVKQINEPQAQTAEAVAPAESIQPQQQEVGTT